MVAVLVFAKKEIKKWKAHRLDEGEPDKEGERSDSAGDHQDHVDEQPRNKKPSERS